MAGIAAEGMRAHVNLAALSKEIKLQSLQHFNLHSDSFRLHPLDSYHVRDLNR